MRDSHRNVKRVRGPRSSGYGLSVPEQINVEIVQSQSRKARTLRRIPGIGKNMEEHLVRLGYTSVAALKGQDPEAMYEEDCRQSGGHVDRCVLYVYRCAVYFAENERHEPDKIKWWNWKDELMR